MRVAFYSRPAATAEARSNGVGDGKTTVFGGSDAAGSSRTTKSFVGRPQMNSHTARAVEALPRSPREYREARAAREDGAHEGHAAA
jgi:hypothetical protein